MKFPVSPNAAGSRRIWPSIRAAFRAHRSGAMLVLAGALAAAAHGQSDYSYTTLAGIGGFKAGVNGTGGAAGAAMFDLPIGVAVRPDGNIYVCDANNSLIRLLTPQGVVTTIAGSVGATGTTDGTGTAALFNAPIGPVTDSAGNLYIADYNGHTIRKVTPAGVVTTFVGSPGVSGGTDGTGTAALFNHPAALAMDSSGTIFVADSGNGTIRKVTSAGVVTTLAGTAGLAGFVDGTGAAAEFDSPRGIAVDKSGNIFVADSASNTIRKVTSAGVVTTIAGKYGTYGATDANGTNARFSFPAGMAIDGTGTLYIADQLNNVIRKLNTTTGDVTTLAGAGPSTTGGYTDGTGTNASFFHPTDVALDSSGNVYVADYGNNLVRRVSPAGVVVTVAGVARVGGAQNGSGYSLYPAYFNNPAGSALDNNGNLYVADTFNNTIRLVTPAGVVSHFAGSPAATGYLDATGTAASFNGPSAIAFDGVSKFYVADTLNHLIRQIDLNGKVTTLAGTTQPTDPNATPPSTNAGYVDGAVASARFNFPSGVAADTVGNVYVADYANHVIRKIANGQVTTFAGTAGSPGKSDGQGATARFDFPRAVAVDASGNVYVADSGNQAIRRITPGGQVTTIAGGNGAGSSDGQGSVAKFNVPSGLSVGPGGNVYVVDANNDTVRLVTPGGSVTTIGGAAGQPGDVDGVNAVARFDHPTGIAVSASGLIYIADTRNETIRLGVPPNGASLAGAPGTATGPSLPGTGSFTGGAGGSDQTGIGGGSQAGGSGFFSRPVSVISDSSGNLYVADTANNCIKRVDTTLVVTVFAGTAGQAGSKDGTGTAAQFNGPTGLAFDGGGNLYVADTGNNTIRMITSAGAVTTIAGSPGASGTADGTGAAARFNRPIGLAVDTTSQVIYVTDSANNTIRQIAMSGYAVTTFAGAAGVVGDADGALLSARFNNPTGIAVYSDLSVFVCDTYNNTIREIVSTATTAPSDPTNPNSPSTTTYHVGTSVITLAGSPGIAGAFDGNRKLSLFNLPSALAVDQNRNVYVVDTGNNCIRQIVNDGSVVTYAGVPGISGSRDAPSHDALFNQPQGIGLGAGIFIADTGNSLIREILGVVFTPTLTNSTSSSGSSGGSSGGTGGTSSGGGGAIGGTWAAAVIGLLALAARRSRRR